MLGVKLYLTRRGDRRASRKSAETDDFQFGGGECVVARFLRPIFYRRHWLLVCRLLSLTTDTVTLPNHNARRL